MKASKVLLILLPGLLILSMFPLQAHAQSALLWEKTWGGSSNDGGSAVVLDSSGNIYLAGATSSFGAGLSDALILKYDSSGNLLWQKTWGGSNNDAANGIALDSSGNIYVTGYTNSFTTGGIDDVLLLKFDSSGSLLWQSAWGGTSRDNNVGNGVMVDSSGNVYVTGITRSLGASAGAGDVLLLKYDSSGNLLWQKTWGGTGDDSGQGIAMDSSGNVYVAGFTPSFGAGGYDVAILKFDSSGNLLWQKTWGGNKDDFGYGVSVDSSGSVYVTGRTDSFGAGLSDVFLLRLDSSGNLVWQKTWGGVSQDEGRGITLDSAGHIYVTGFTSSFGTGADDAVVLKFDSSGNLLGQTTWGGSGGDCACGTPAVDSSGNIFVTGYVTEAPPYSLGSGNLTLGTPSFTLGTPNKALLSPSFTPITPSGTVGTPSGSESYAGAQDLFLFKYAFSTSSPDFRITATPASTSVLAGAEAISTIAVTSLNGFSDSVSLGISITPGNGLTCTLNLATITGGSGSATLSCSGSYWGYTVTITGTSGALSHAVPVNVVVQDYTVTASSSSITTNAGTAGTATIDISPHDGFTGTVNLSSAVNASGLTCTVSPASVPGGSGSSTLSCSGSAGAYSVDVTTMSGSLSHHVQVSVSVAAASSPQPAPSSQTIFGLAPIIFYAIIGGIAVVILGSAAVMLGRRGSRPT